MKPTTKYFLLINDDLKDDWDETQGIEVWLGWTSYCKLKFFNTEIDLIKYLWKRVKDYADIIGDENGLDKIQDYENSKVYKKRVNIREKWENYFNHLNNNVSYDKIEEFAKDIKEVAAEEEFNICFGKLSEIKSIEYNK